jgi:hypothetical protein
MGGQGALVNERRSVEEDESSQILIGEDGAKGREEEQAEARTIFSLAMIK